MVRFNEMIILHSIYLFHIIWVGVCMQACVKVTGQLLGVPEIQFRSSSSVTRPFTHCTISPVLKCHFCLFLPVVTKSRVSQAGLSLLWSWRRPWTSHFPASTLWMPGCRHASVTLICAILGVRPRVLRMPGQHANHWATPPTWSAVSFFLSEMESCYVAIQK